MTEELSKLRAHALKMGQVIGNLHALEMVLRAFLYRQEFQADSSKAIRPALFNLTEGDRVVENYITNYDTLNTLIANYNQAVESIDSTLAVDNKIVKLRDALAHGRILSNKEERPLRLFKFSKASDGQVTVTHALVLTDQWFKDQLLRVRKEIQKVEAALEKIN